MEPFTARDAVEGPVQHSVGQACRERHAEHAEVRQTAARETLPRLKNQKGYDKRHVSAACTQAQARCITGSTDREQEVREGRCAHGLSQTRAPEEPIQELLVVVREAPADLLPPVLHINRALLPTTAPGWHSRLTLCDLAPV